MRSGGEKYTLGDQSFRSRWLSDKEFEVRQLLERASLVVEINLSEDDLRQIQLFYGERVANAVRTDVPVTTVIRRFPALTLAILVGQAALRYEQTRYWDEFFTELGLDRDEAVADVFRHELRQLLRKFGLRDFPELANDYVQLMALHSGLPVYCLGDVLDTIENRMLAGDEVSGAALIEWWMEPGKSYRFRELDAPARNFVQLGGELAVNLLDRICDFAEYTVVTEGWAEQSIDLDTGNTGLPTIMLDALVARLTDNPIGSGLGTVAPRRKRRRRASVVLSPDERQVLVEVPYPSADGDLPWRVSFDGSTRDVYAERGWGVGTGQEHPPTPIAVPSPVREIVLRHDASGESATLPLIDKMDPLLVFELDGRRITKLESLPDESVVVIHPRDARIVDADYNEGIAPKSEWGTPVGWEGWACNEYDLSQIGAFALERAGRASARVAHRVRNTVAPRLHLGEPIVGVHALNGLTVYGERPAIDLPATSSKNRLDWRVQVRRSGSRQWLIDEWWTSSDEVTTVDPFSGYGAGVLGLYEIIVTGSSGVDLPCQTLFLAEGLDISLSEAFRYPTDGGLSETTVEISTSHGLSVNVEQLVLETSRRDATVDVSDGDHTARLRIRPPHAEIRVDPYGAPAQWRTTAVVMTPAELDEELTLGLRLDADVTVEFALVDAADEVLFSVTPASRGGGIHTQSSRVFFDVARDLDECWVVALIDEVIDEQVYTTTVHIAYVRPTALYGSVSLLDGSLLIDDLAQVDDVAVNVWMTTAPWRRARTVEVHGPRVALPDDLVDSGPLLIQVFVDDPWVSLPVPEWPDSTAIRLDQAGWVHDEHPGRDALSRFLAGVGEVPEQTDIVAEVWTALSVLPDDTTTLPLRRSLSYLARINSREALNAIGNSTISSAEMMDLVIRTGLVRRPFTADDTANELHAHPWVGCMVEMADLPSLFERRHLVDAEREETLAYLGDKGGPMLMDLLRSGRSDEIASGVFSAAQVGWDSMGDEAIDALAEASQLVPGALLDLDTRVVGTFAAFRARHKLRELGWDARFVSKMSRAVGVVNSYCRPAYDQLGRRAEALSGIAMASHPWLYFSFVSLLLALIARLEAHDLVGRSVLNEENTAFWSEIARLCPDAVMSDLLIAEALVTHAHNGNLIGDNE
ncbi:hypothetical protein HCA61_18655 [Rhodococcus sp. HNM0563]|uniref:hypothetical protein n=1 Tax=Rhodococcus sp. HNM0563 TaxID=2716339 RepID=UPI00146EE9F1|nr:hypothetical protein [Rhodococcus sp. HNM0563]NLU64270.1 hypothetical protein [Rhodococcus sp. HNM0563]